MGILNSHISGLLEKACTWSEIYGRPFSITFPGGKGDGDFSSHISGLSEKGSANGQSPIALPSSEFSSPFLGGKGDKGEWVSRNQV